MTEKNIKLCGPLQRKTAKVVIRLERYWEVICDDRSAKQHKLLPEQHIDFGARKIRKVGFRLVCNQPLPVS